MIHPDCDRRLLPFALGELEPSAAAQVRSHVALCPACAHEVAAFAALRAQLPPVLSARESEVEAARRKLEARLRGVRHPLVLTRSERRLFTAVLLAASILGLLVLRSYVPIEPPSLPSQVHELKDRVLSRISWDVFPSLPLGKEKSGA